MRRHLLLLVFVMSMAQTVLGQTVSDKVNTAQRRPRVAVVLSGGGAKGMAHIGALKVIERAGIPIDIITEACTHAGTAPKSSTL